MKKTVLVFGGISGLISALMFFITIPLYESGALDLNNGMYIGYTTMVIASSMIFFGIKSYRDKQLGGVIKFGNAMKVGALIALVASIIYAVGWEIDYNFVYPDFMDFYAKCMIKKATDDGASAAEMQKLTTQVSQMKEMYKSPVLRFGMTMFEILPVGILFALISSAILRKKEVLPSNA